MSINQQTKNLNGHKDGLENYFRNTILPQLFVDADLILRKFTPPAMKQFNLTMDDVGKSIIDIRDNFRFPSLIENIQHVIRYNDILEKDIQTTDLRWYQMNISSYARQSDNKINGVIVTFVEITFRIKDLKDLEKLIADHEILLDMLTHDIKNPLTSLTLAVSLFKDIDQTNQAEFQPLLAIVERAVGKMKNLIYDLTESRRHEYKHKANIELLNFEHVLDDVRLTLKDNISSSGAIIKSQINIPQISFSRIKLRSIIYNLVNNSIKYKSPERDPEIFIETARDKDYVVISIKDNGMGIDASKHESIFSKYYRLNNSIEGSGIGLYLVKEIVSNSGGKISLESQPDKGTEIKVFLKEGQVSY